MNGSSSDNPTTAARQRTPKYQQIAEEVARLRERKGLSFEDIRQMLDVSRHTVERAYDHAGQEQAHAPLNAGKRLDRGRTPNIGIEKYQKIRKLLAAGKRVIENAKTVGCGPSTVYRELKRLKLAG